MFRNRIKFSPSQSARYCQINLGLTSKGIAEEIRDCLELVNLPLLVRVGKIKSELKQNKYVHVKTFGQ